MIAGTVYLATYIESYVELTLDHILAYLHKYSTYVIGHLSVEGPLILLWYPLLIVFILRRLGLNLSVGSYSPPTSVISRLTQSQMVRETSRSTSHQSSIAEIFLSKYNMLATSFSGTLTSATCRGFPIYRIPLKKSTGKSTAYHTTSFNCANSTNPEIGGTLTLTILGRLSFTLGAKSTQ